jgi:uncharacterized MnhB-related membrane protein
MNILSRTLHRTTLHGVLLCLALLLPDLALAQALCGAALSRLYWRPEIYS